MFSLRPTFQNGCDHKENNVSIHAKMGFENPLDFIAQFMCISTYEINSSTSSSGSDDGLAGGGKICRQANVMLCWLVAVWGSSLLSA